MATKKKFAPRPARTEPARKAYEDDPVVKMARRLAAIADEGRKLRNFGEKHARDMQERQKDRLRFAQSELNLEEKATRQMMMATKPTSAAGRHLLLALACGRLQEIEFQCQFPRHVNHAGLHDIQAVATQASVALHHAARVAMDALPDQELQGVFYRLAGGNFCAGAEYALSCVENDAPMSL